MSGRRSVTRNVRRPTRGAPLRRARVRRLLRLAPALGALVAVSGLAVAVPGLWAWCRTHPYFALREVDIGGHARLTRQEVLAAAGVQLGASVWDAAPDALALRLQRSPWIESVTVERRFPDSLHIEVRERKPVAIARVGGLYYVDEEGRLLGQLRDEDSPDFPLITGLEEEENGPFTSVALHRAARLLQSCTDAGWLDSVSEIHVDRDEGVTVFPLQPAVPVILGWGQWDEKLVRAARVLATWAGREKEVLQVDASFADRVVVRLRSGSTPSQTRNREKGIQV